MAITGLSVHPTNDYLLLSSLDEYWSFVDLESGAIYARVRGDDGESEPGMAITSANFHPDGLIFATGTFGADVKVWDVKEQQNVATFNGHGGTVVAVTFPENGYYLATAADDASVKLWNLRQLKNFKTFQMEPGFKITDVTFDFSGS
jgi:pre-mRNA-processing factor 19